MIVAGFSDNCIKKKMDSMARGDNLPQSKEGNDDVSSYLLCLNSYKATLEYVLREQEVKYVGVSWGKEGGPLSCS